MYMDGGRGIGAVAFSPSLVFFFWGGGESSSTYLGLGCEPNRTNATGRMPCCCGCFFPLRHTPLAAAAAAATAATFNENKSALH